MRSLAALDGTDLRSLTCPWCGRTPQGATLGFKAVREGAVVGMVAAIPGSELGGAHPASSVVIVQAWVRPDDVHELIGTQLVHRLAATALTGRARCLVAPGTRGVPDCRHLPADFLESLGFTESVTGRQWRLDLRRTVPALSALRGLVDGVARLGRQVRPSPAGRG